MNKVSGMLDAIILEVITQIPSLLDTSETTLFTEPHSPLGIQQAVILKGDGEIFSDSQEGLKMNTGPSTQGDKWRFNLA